MKKTASSTRFPFWWENRKWGVVAFARHDGLPVGSVFPHPNVPDLWVFESKWGEWISCVSVGAARSLADRKLGDELTWYFYPVTRDWRGERPKRRSTR